MAAQPDIQQQDLLIEPGMEIDDDIRRVFYEALLERVREDRDFRLMFIEEFRNYQEPGLEGQAVGGAIA